MDRRVYSIPLFRGVDCPLNRATFYLRPDQLLTGVSYVLEEDVDLETTHDVTRYY